MSPSYKYKLNMSKAELVDKLELIVRRWKSDPNISRLLVTELGINLKLMRRFMKEDDAPKFWNNWCELFDEIRGYNDRKGDKALEKLNPLYEKQVIKNILYVPGVTSEYDVRKVLATANLNVRVS